MKRPNKYGAKRTVVDGISFASALEAKRWTELKLLERAGEIRCLTRQTVFLLPRHGPVSARYIADFVYVELSGTRVIEDVKGFETAEFKVKWSWMKHAYPEIDFRLIKRASVRRAA